MSGATMTALTVFSAVFAALYGAHQVADHWVQTDYQARMKGAPGWVGRWACARHVATLTITKLGALGALVVVTGWRPGAGLLVGLVLDALSHYWIDRRTPLARLAVLAERCGINGKTRFLVLGVPRAGRDDNPSLGTGGYALDQAWHVGWLIIAALVGAW